MYKVQKPPNPEASQEITRNLWPRGFIAIFTKASPCDVSYTELNKFNIHPPIPIPEDSLQIDNTCKI
jgi:hypothetical protein